jgi:hypothetical protein
VICTTWPNYDHHSQRGKLKVPNGFEEWVKEYLQINSSYPCTLCGIYGKIIHTGKDRWNEKYKNSDGIVKDVLLFSTTLFQ